METVEELEAFQKRLSDGKKFDVMVRDNTFCFMQFTKLVFAQSNVLPLNPLCRKILIIASLNNPLILGHHFSKRFRSIHCCFIVPFIRLNTCAVLVEKPYETMSRTF